MCDMSNAATLEVVKILNTHKHAVVRNLTSASAYLVNHPEMCDSKKENLQGLINVLVDAALVVELELTRLAFVFDRPEGEDLSDPDDDELMGLLEKKMPKSLARRAFRLHSEMVVREYLRGAVDELDL